MIKSLPHILFALLLTLGQAASAQTVHKPQSDLERCGLKGKVAMWKWQDDVEQQYKTYVFNEAGNFSCIMSGGDTTIFCDYEEKELHTLCSVYNMANNQTVYLGKMDKALNTEGLPVLITLTDPNGNVTRKDSVNTSWSHSVFDSNNQLSERYGVEIPLLRDFDALGLPPSPAFSNNSGHPTLFNYSEEGELTSVLLFNTGRGAYDAYTYKRKTDTESIFRMGNQHLSFDSELRITSVYTTDANTMDNTGETYEFDYYGNIVEVIPISDVEGDTFHIQIYYR